MFAGNTVDLLFSLGGGDPSIAASRRAINEAGQVTFFTQFADITTAVGLFTPELSISGVSSVAWEDAGWTLGLTPGAVHAVAIDPAVGLTVAGPAGDVVVRALTVGGGEGVGRFELGSGVVGVAEGVSVVERGVLAGSGVIDGDLAVGAMGRVEVVIDASGGGALVGDGGDGAAAGDRVDVTGSVSLGGTLGVVLEGAALPEIGDEVVVMTYADRGGTVFGLLEGVVLDEGLALAPEFGAGSLVLRASVPGDVNLDDRVGVSDPVDVRASLRDVAGGGELGFGRLQRGRFGVGIGPELAGVELWFRAGGERGVGLELGGGGGDGGDRRGGVARAGGGGVGPGGGGGDADWP